MGPQVVLTFLPSTAAIVEPLQLRIGMVETINGWPAIGRLVVLVSVNKFVVQRERTVKDHKTPIIGTVGCLQADQPPVPIHANSTYKVGDSLNALLPSLGQALVHMAPCSSTVLERGVSDNAQRAREKR